jgi:hypothetical protein
MLAVTLVPMIFSTRYERHAMLRLLNFNSKGILLGWTIVSIFSRKTDCSGSRPGRTFDIRFGLLIQLVLGSGLAVLFSGISSAGIGIEPSSPSPVMTCPIVCQIVEVNDE